MSANDEFSKIIAQLKSFNSVLEDEGKDIISDYAELQSKIKLLSDNQELNEEQSKLIFDLHQSLLNEVSILKDKVKLKIIDHNKTQKSLKKYKNI